MNERIWIYTISKELTVEQLIDLENRCKSFVTTWTAHDVSLDASFELYKNRLLIFKVNEDSYGASGCSIDKQLHLVKELEQVFSVELLNRMLVAYQYNDGVKVATKSQVKELLAKKLITENTLVFDNTITLQSQLKTEWLKPLKHTWLAQFISTTGV